MGLIDEVMTFGEATKLWKLGNSTLRMMAKTDRLVEGVDYRKSERAWLITKTAMEKLYGELEMK